MRRGEGVKIDLETKRKCVELAKQGMTAREIYNDFFKRQTTLLILIMVLTILYIDNRYSSQQELIEIDRLKKELTDRKYNALTRSSELMEKSRQSRIEEYISTGESPLETATNRPYLIQKD